MKGLLERFAKKGRAFDSYLEIRRKTLESVGNEINRLEELRNCSVHAMLCDFNFSTMEEGERFTTLSCYADGTVDLVHSKGGGVFGAGQNSEKVKNACVHLLKNTDEALAHFNKTEDFFLPELDSARIYAVTASGVYMIEYNIYLAWVHDEDLLRIRILSDELISEIRRYNRSK
jgi:hypothetical protein